MDGKHFSIVDSAEVKTVVYVINETEEFLRDTAPKYTVERLRSTEQISGNKIKKIFHVEELILEEKDIVVFSFSKDRVLINTGSISETEVRISKKSIPIKFNPLYTEIESEYKEFKYTPNFKRQISIIDPETTEEVKPVLYFDPIDNTVKGKCTLKPYKAYFSFQISDDK